MGGFGLFVILFFCFLSVCCMCVEFFFLCFILDCRFLFLNFSEERAQSERVAVAVSATWQQFY